VKCSERGWVMINIYYRLNNSDTLLHKASTTTTITCLAMHLFSHNVEVGDEIQTHIDIAIGINMCYESNPEIAGREKVITSHLDSQKRALICRLQEVDHSLYSEINPLHLPEVLSLIGERPVTLL
jgi:hypothetical protein